MIKYNWYGGFGVTPVHKLCQGRCYTLIVKAGSDLKL